MSVHELNHVDRVRLVGVRYADGASPLPGTVIGTDVGSPGVAPVEFGCFRNPRVSLMACLGLKKGAVGWPPTGRRRAGGRGVCGVTLVGMSGERTLTAAVHQEDDWFVAQCLEVDVASQGESIPEALDNLRQAVELYLSETADPLVTPTPLVTAFQIPA